MTVRTAVLAGLAALLLAGCAAQPAPQPFGVPGAPTTAPAAPEPTPADLELYGPRVELPGGVLLKQVGKVAAFARPGSADFRDDWVMRIVLDRIELDPDCGGFALDSGRPHRLVLSVRVETSAQYDPIQHGIPQYFEWSTTGPDGVTEAPPGSSSDCRNGKGFPSELRPSAKYRGEVSVATSNPAGQLVLSNAFAWNYPTP